MTTMSVHYLGDLQVENVHDDSGAVIVTTAPKDNGGTGDKFSPTDLCATALASCAMTIMGLYAKNQGLDITGATAKVGKFMGANPRRISRIEVEFTMPAMGFSDKDKKGLERAALTCPIHQTLHPDTEQKFSFVWL